MVPQCQDVISLPLSSGETPGQPFSFDVLLASPLNFVGARCRFRHIRKQATRLVKTAVKSSWNSEHCALFAHYIMQTEESGLGTVKHCKDIPSENRIRRIYSDICCEEHHIKLSYIRYPYTARSPMHVAIISLKVSRTVSTECSVETEPIVPDVQSWSSNAEAGDNVTPSSSED
jgi:hypothetical protein